MPTSILQGKKHFIFSLEIHYLLLFNCGGEILNTEIDTVALHQM